MEDIVTKFIEEMRASGLGPAKESDIIADDKRHNYQLSNNKKNKKTGHYRLKIANDFGYGFFGDYRTDEFISWYSTTNKKYTEEEKAAFARHSKAEKLKREVEQKEAHNRAATEAQDFILFLDSCAEHPYLETKNVKSYGTLLSGKDLIIPMSDTSGVCNYQTIKPNGTKLFLKGAKKQGTWFVIPGTDTIAVTEGFATGATVHEATGYTIIILFDAGNLLYTAPYIKERYPDRDIIICADNDWDTIINGKPHNTGLIKGTRAAMEIGCKIAWPEFDTSLKNGHKAPSDFNDYRETHSLDDIKNIIQAAGYPESDRAVMGRDSSGDIDLQSHDVPDPEDWQDQFIRNKKSGIIEPRSTINILLVMESDPDLDGVFKYDSFAKRLIIFKCPPWEKPQYFKVRPIDDSVYIRLEAYVEGTWGLKISKDKSSDAIIATAQLDKNTFNPASDYFDNLEWDGVSRLETWLEKYVACNKQPKNYLSMVGAKFMCGLAARAIRPGIKFDTMIIFEGNQYAGKSYLARIMATVEGVEYFLDDFKDIENKDALMKMQGKLVVEFPEISTMRKSEVNDLKAFVSRQEDEFRPPYGRNTVTAPRQCVFIGTVNPEGPYLRDVTGNRRYWPVSCRNKLPIDELKAVMPQLHAEAVYLVKHGEKLWLSDTEYQMACKEQDKRVMADIWTDRIEEIVSTKFDISTDELLDSLGINTDKRNPMVYSRIHQTMSMLGWEACRVGTGKARKRGFKIIKKTENSYQQIDF